MQPVFSDRVYYRFKLDANHSYAQTTESLRLESAKLRRVYNDYGNGT